EPASQARIVDDGEQATPPVVLVRGEEPVLAVTDDAPKSVGRGRDGRDAERTGLEILDLALRIAERVIAAQRYELHVARRERGEHLVPREERQALDARGKRGESGMRQQMA